MSDEMTVRQYVAEKLMEFSGFGDKEKWPLEWDPDQPDSQLAGYLEIADVSVSATIDALQSIGLIPEDQYDEVKELEENFQYYVGQEYPTNRVMTLYLTLKSEVGKPLTLADLRNFLREIDDLDLPNSTEIEGFIDIMYDLGLSKVEITDYFSDDGDTKALILHPRGSDTSVNPFSPNHPSVFSKDPEFLKKKTMDALLKKYGYLLDQGDKSEAEKIFDEIQRLKEEK